MAHASGFGNLSHFIRVFRQKASLSPEQFQQKILLDRRSRCLIEQAEALAAANDY